MAGWLGMARLAAPAVAALALSACDTAKIIDRFALPESPDVAAAPWPRLVDVPGAPPVGSYTAAVPNPAEGAEIRTDLTAAAVAADVRAAELSGPVIDDAERAAMMAAAERAR